MLTKRRSRFGRRSGISTLIGAIFFVLVVFLVFSSTVLIFETFTNYATAFKQVNSQDIQNKATSLSFSGLAFGGVVSKSAAESFQTVVNAKSSSLLPVQNMNFTGGMQGWTFSRSFQLSLHNGTVTESPANVLPGLEIYTLTVANKDTAAVYPTGTYITSVQISVSPSFQVPGSLQQAPAGWILASTTPSSITWTTPPGICTNGIFNSGPITSQSFFWAAVAPTVTGSFSHTVTVTWQDFSGAACSVVKDKGLAPASTNVVTSQPGGQYVASIFSVARNTVPGGAFGGYDSTSADVGSSSGPGSLYLTYGPTLNNKPLVSGKQLSVQMNFTTDFKLTSPLALGPSCCVLSLGYALDSLTSNSSQILMSVYLTDLSHTCGGAGTALSYKQIINNTVVNQLNGQNVSRTGWLANNVKFTPGVGTCAVQNIESVSGQLHGPDLYQLTIAISATLFGSNPPFADYPASMVMNFDDAGLALQENNAVSYCADTASSLTQPCYIPACTPGPLCSISIPTGVVNPQQVQSIQFKAQVAESAPGPGVSTTAYAYVENVGSSTFLPDWVELGQVTFTSSATITATIPASSASAYIDEVGNTCGPPGSGSVCVRIYAIQQPTETPLAVNVSLSLQSWNPTAASLYVLNNGTAPIHVVGLFVAGPGVQFANSALINTWVSPGENLWLPLGNQVNSQLPTFAWSTGQTYVVRIITDEGIQVSGTFVSP